MENSKNIDELFEQLDKNTQLIDEIKIDDKFIELNDKLLEDIEEYDKKIDKTTNLSYETLHKTFSI